MLDFFFFNSQTFRKSYIVDVETDKNASRFMDTVLAAHPQE